MIQIDGVSRLYGDRVALESVSLRIDTGESVALMGPNGAGKSTLLRCVAGLTRATSGRITIDSGSVRDPKTRRRVGLLAHESYLYGPLTLEENLRFYGKLFGVAAPPIETLIGDVALEWARDLRVDTFSRGMEQRAALARVLVPDPDVLLLDEPFAGLDHVASTTLFERLSAWHRSDRTMVVVTHDPIQAAKLVKRVVVLVQGRVAWDGPVDEDPEAFALHYARLVSAEARVS